MLYAIIKILLAYALGSISGSLLLGRARHVDIRTLGSGNAGGTNALRTQGLRFALGVVLIDVGKGAIAAGVLPGLFLPDATLPPDRLVLACALAAVVGHCFPVWHGFRGGKGAATAVGAIAVLSPWLLIPMLATWIVVLALTGFVGLATVLAGIALVPAVAYRELSPPFMTFAVVVALFMVFTHRKNITAMLRGTEHRFERARIQNWFGSGPGKT